MRATLSLAFINWLRSWILLGSQLHTLQDSHEVTIIIIIIILAESIEITIITNKFEEHILGATAHDFQLYRLLISD